MLASMAETKVELPSTPISDVANWIHEFSAYLQEYLQTSSNLTPNLAMKFSLTGNESSINLVVKEGSVSTYKEDLEKKPHKNLNESELNSFSMQLNEEHAVNALCATDSQSLLSSILKSGCKLHGMVEPFIWFMARFIDYRLNQ